MTKQKEREESYYGKEVRIKEEEQTALDALEIAEHMLPFNLHASSVEDDDGPIAEEKRRSNLPSMFTT